MHGRALPLLCLLLAMASSAVQANDDDTRRLLNQIDRNLNERERSHLVEETPPDVDPSALITINGTTYSVDATLTVVTPEPAPLTAFGEEAGDTWGRALGLGDLSDVGHGVAPSSRVTGYLILVTRLRYLATI